jgi:hypothetical protein
MTLYGIEDRMARLVLDRATFERVREARARVKALGLSKTWIAAQIGRSRPNVSEVLNATISSPGTLRLIEALLSKLEREAEVTA